MLKTDAAKAAVQFPLQSAPCLFIGIPQRFYCSGEPLKVFSFLGFKDPIQLLLNKPVRHTRKPKAMKLQECFNKFGCLE